MNYEIVLYDVKVVPLKNAVCKVVFTENQTRNVVGVVFHSHDQIKALMDQLRQYSTPPPSWGMPDEEIDRTVPR